MSISSGRRRAISRPATRGPKTSRFPAWALTLRDGEVKHQAKMTSMHMAFTAARERLPSCTIPHSPMCFHRRLYS